jgi:hypothetical protein
MKNETTFIQSIIRVALGTILLLLVPYVAMQFTNEVNWSPADFIIMGALLFAIGFSFVLATRFVSNIVYKIAISFALGSTFLMVWSNLAVGLIGGGAHWGNFMYMGVLAVGIIGTILSRLTPGGIEWTMYGMSFTFVLIAAIALFANMQEYPGSSVLEIIGVNGFFALLYAVSGLLFRFVALEQSKQAR